MNDINFDNNIVITWNDDYVKGDSTKPKMLITQYFENGTAVHIRLNEREVSRLYEVMQKIDITPL